MGRLRSLTLCTLAMVAAIGCLPRVRPQQPIDVTTVFTCGGGYQFSVRELGEVATVRSDTQTIVLPRIRSALGSRYRSGDLEFRRRGQAATLRRGAVNHADCVGQIVSTPWDESRLLGVEYRAAGSEPTWSVEIDEGKYIRFMVAGGSPVYAPVPQPIADSTRRILRTASGSQPLEVLVEATACWNATSLEPFPHTVTVTFNGFPYTGCGRPLSPS